MQNGNEQLTWTDVLKQLVEQDNEIRKLKEENKQLTERLQISEAYRFCDNSSVIIK